MAVTRDVSVANRGAESNDLRPGDRVEVWCQSTGRWSPGFTIEDLTATDAVTVTRNSDHVTLPALFPMGDVRRSPLAQFNEDRARRAHPTRNWGPR